MFKVFLLSLTIIGAFSQPGFGSNLGTLFNDDNCCDHDEIEVSG